jgi:hypothetical protein
MSRIGVVERFEVEEVGVAGDLMTTAGVRSRSRIGVVERFEAEEVGVAGVELACDLMTTAGVIARDLTMVSVGADGVIVSLGSQSTKLY